MAKDWKGNSNSIYKTLGASNHTDEERESNDFYATDPISIDILLGVEKFYGRIWEPSCGAGHMSKRLTELGYDVYSSDLIDRGYGESPIDFLKCDSNLDRDIITNPPYKYAVEFVEKALSLAHNKVAMFLKLTFLEGKSRKILFYSHPPKVVYVSYSRIMCAKNGDFQKMVEGGGSAAAYAWFVWDKSYEGKTYLEWVN